MQPSPSQGSSHDHLPAAGPAVEDHGRVVTTSPQAAAWYRRAQRAADPCRAAEALLLAVTADPDFALAAADLEAIIGTPGRHPGRRPMNWERHHIEVVSAAAAGQVTRASDLLREHLASVGCDPLAVRITARLREPMAKDNDLEDLASQLPGCHATPWPGSPLTP
jgi:hypothetical protein